MGRIHPVGPNAAIVVTSSKKRKRIISGGWAYVPPLIANVQYLSLTLMTLKPECSDVETIEGVRINVSAVAQCKIMNSPEFLLIAAEQFLGKRPHQIGRSVVLTLEGHLRAILGTLTVEEAYKDRTKFANLVYEVAARDVAKMGIQIVSFVIKDIDDTVGYLSSLGKSRTAEVKRDAAIGVALANRDAGIREAECEREANAVIYKTKVNVENYSRMYNLQKSQFDKEINSAKAEAELAYSLELAKIQQQLRHEEISIDIVERKKHIEIEQKEIQRKERELASMIKLPSDAESYRIQTIAEGNKAKVIENAIGESERIKKIGEVEAYKAKLIGVRAAERMRNRALALQNYGDVAIKGLIISSLPELASKISAPLAKIDEIVLLSGNNADVIDSLISLAARLPPAMQALQVGDLKKVVNAHVGKRSSAQ